MVNWMIENKEWVFSGVGVTLLVAIMGAAKRKAGFKITHKFYIILFLALTVTFGLDYLVNRNCDWRLTIFLFGSTTVVIYILNWLILRINDVYTMKMTIKKLSFDDCEYIIRCYEKDEYFSFDFTNHLAFQEKWGNTLYIPTGRRIVLNEPYKICADQRAYKMAKRRLQGEHK